MPDPRPVRRLALAAMATALAFVAVHCLFFRTWTIQRRTPMAVKNWFDLRNDYSLPSWFGFLCLSAAGIACLRWGQRSGRRGILTTGVLFLFLTVDDLLMLHERIGGLFAESLSRTGTYAWVLVLVIPLCLSGLVAAWSCWSALAGDRPARRMLFGGFACLGTSMVIEAFEQKVTHSGLRWRELDLVLYTQVVEETLEMVGPLLVAWAAAEAWRRPPQRPRRAPRTMAAAAAVLVAAPQEQEQEVGCGV